MQGNSNFIQNNMKISKSDKLFSIIPNVNKNEKFFCEHIFLELTSLCPTTSLPDFYTLNIKYEPDNNLIELKSFKKYLIKYRQEKIYHEEIANKIMNHFIQKVKPRWVNLTLKVNIRGGIETIIRRSWNKKREIL